MALGLVAAACGSDSASGGDDAAVADDAGSSDGGSDGGSTEGVAGNLADCPNPIVIQTDWFPESEHGAVYNLTGGEGSVDPSPVASVVRSAQIPASRSRFAPAVRSWVTRRRLP
ncbi:MAG: hypothetical protein R2710_22965 [Acidimicrobiales bacterium]